MSEVSEDTVGKFFTDEKGNIWRQISFCAYPTASFKKVGSENICKGAVQSPNVTQFTLLPVAQQKIVKKTVEQIGAN